FCLKFELQLVSPAFIPRASCRARRAGFASIAKKGCWLVARFMGRPLLLALAGSPRLEGGDPGREFVMPKRMLIDATHPEQTRVAVVDGRRLDEYDFETVSRQQLKGNIYLAKVVRIEPSLQAAFVEYGGNRHGFLAFSEIHPDYYRIPVA